jgi:hypothetical protein
MGRPTVERTPPHLRVREELPGGLGLIVAVGVDSSGTYLVIVVPGRSGPCWVCAPATERALGCVRDGTSSPWAVVHHSATGTIGLFRTLLDGSIRESEVLCSDLPAGAGLLSAA